jgi:hypothetical protein
VSQMKRYLTEDEEDVVWKVLYNGSTQSKWGLGLLKHWLIGWFKIRWVRTLS